MFIDRWMHKEDMIHTQEYDSAMKKNEIMLIGKDPDAGRDWGQEEKGMTKDEMAGWHHRLNGREFEWILGDGDGQGGLACCNPWGRKQSDTTEQLNWTELNEYQNWLSNPKYFEPRTNVIFATSAAYLVLHFHESFLGVGTEGRSWQQ